MPALPDQKESVDEPILSVKTYISKETHPNPGMMEHRLSVFKIRDQVIFIAL